MTWNIVAPEAIFVYSMKWSKSRKNRIIWNVMYVSVLNSPGIMYKEPSPYHEKHPQTSSRHHRTWRLELCTSITDARLTFAENAHPTENSYHVTPRSIKQFYSSPQFICDVRNLNRRSKQSMSGGFVRWECSLVCERKPFVDIECVQFIPQIIGAHHNPCCLLKLIYISSLLFFWIVLFTLRRILVCSSCHNSRSLPLFQDLNNIWPYLW